MLWIYRLLFLPTVLVASPHYLRRMSRRGGYGRNFLQRFGSHPARPVGTSRPKRVWLQAVSVGEMLAIAPLVEALHRDGVEIYITTTTSTGYRLAQERYHALACGIGYFPLDWWAFSARAWSRIDPDLAILTEGERWPEHLHQAARRQVPVVAINARLSDRSFHRLQRFPRTAHWLLGRISTLLAASTQDATRFRELGFPADHLEVTGNIKLDVTLPALDAAQIAQLRLELGFPVGSLILVGASTWPGEEAALVNALRAARERGLTCSLLLVPRHAERRSEIESELAPSGLHWHLRSRGAAAGQVDIAIADTTGELRRLLQLADVVFVGKSLPPHSEGQTPVEAAALEKPILFGPGMKNFREIARDLLARGAALEVRSAAELASVATELLKDTARRHELASSAARWHRDNAGALARTLRVLREMLARIPSP